MASYELRFKRSVAKDLRAIPGADVKRILARIDQLSEAPRGAGCQKLTGRELYRVRVGRYRVIYEIVDDEVVLIVVKVGHRARIYDH